MLLAHQTLKLLRRSPHFI